MISRRLQNMGRDIIENIVCEDVDFVVRKNNMDKFKFSSFQVLMNVYEKYLRNW